jgi:hypothetical protein
MIVVTGIKIPGTPGVTDKLKKHPECDFFVGKKNYKEDEAKRVM